MLESDFKIKFREVEEGTMFINSNYDELLDTQKKMDSQIQDISRKVKEISTADNEATLRDSVVSVTEKVVELQARDMRDNLVFKGLAECKEEDCEAIIKNFLREKLEIMNDIEIVRAHRIGKVQRGNKAPDQGQSGEGQDPGATGDDSSRNSSTATWPRPIVAKFQRYIKYEYGLVKLKAAAYNFNMDNGHAKT